MSDAAQDNGAVLQSESVADGVTQFRRVEDGQWDPTNRNDFYFVTTDAFGGITRLWRLRFDDVRHPELGGRSTSSSARGRASRARCSTT